MKALILSITAGGGHNSTAAAISSYLEGMGAECRTLDTYAYLNKLLGDIVAKGYLASVDNAKLAYDKIYHSFEKRKKNGNQKSAVRTANGLFVKKLHDYIEIFDPDVIISTHIFSAMIVDIMKQKQTIRAKTIGIVTDFTMHPFWEEGIHFDYLVIANEYLSSQAIKKGFSSDQILPFGIPIHPKFSENIPKDKAREMLGLDKDKKTVLVMSGSMGYGNPCELIEKLENIPYDFQLICVCGNNAKAKSAIDSMEHKKTIINFGFSNEIDKLMDAADIIVGKPGGLTTSEALAKELPMVLINPIPGQEMRNVEFLLNAGAAMAVNDMLPLEDIISELLNDENRLAAMKSAVKLISKPNATKDICEFAFGIADKK